MMFVCGEMMLLLAERQIKEDFRLGENPFVFNYLP